MIDLFPAALVAGKPKGRQAALSESGHAEPLDEAEGAVQAAVVEAVGLVGLADSAAQRPMALADQLETQFQCDLDQGLEVVDRLGQIGVQVVEPFVNQFPLGG